MNACPRGGGQILERVTRFRLPRPASPTSGVTRKLRFVGVMVGALASASMCVVAGLSSFQNEGTRLLTTKPSASVVKLEGDAGGFFSVGRVGRAVGAGRAAATKE